jgi:hypothetical protein
MKKLTTFFFCLISVTLFAQTSISGIVYDAENNPLEGASVYINNTSIGTTTNMEGEFNLSLSAGVHELIISYVGFNSRKYLLDPKNYKKQFSVKLTPKDNMLDEVVIKRKKRIPRSKRNLYLRRFKKAFLGASKFGESCKIQNEKVLGFDFDTKTKTLEVSASKPLIIINKALGYKISYDLLHFDLTPVSIRHLGNVKYTKLKGSEKEESEWVDNRFEAYQGSKMHYLRSVLKNEIEEEGFVVDQIKHIPNPERPSYEEIIAAEKFLTRHSGLQKNPYKRSSEIDNGIINAENVIARSQLPEFIDELIESNFILRKYALLHHDGEIYLKFSEFLRITYTKEAPDRNYKIPQENSKYQVSMFKLTNKNNFVQIHKLGVFKKPLDVFIQGYWAFEKVGDALPFNYKPD